MAPLTNKKKDAGERITKREHKRPAFFKLHTKIITSIIIDAIFVRLRHSHCQGIILRQSSNAKSTSSSFPQRIVYAKADTGMNKAAKP
ncbi:unnamed protein product [Ixodes pacificus]